MDPWCSRECKDQLEGIQIFFIRSLTMARTITATGLSTKLSFNEALDNAVEEIDDSSFKNIPDYTLKVFVKEIRAEYGGIAGSQTLFVTVTASVP
jgi:hypothetical protein